MQLYLIRHAQSQNNALWAATKSEDGRVPDPEITEIGHQQGKALGEYIAAGEAEPVHPQEDPHNRKGFHLTHLYCSLMTRAVQTASYIAKATDLPLVGLDNVHEWGGLYSFDVEQELYTAVSGPNRAYFAERFPHLGLPDYLGEAGWYDKRPYEERTETAARAENFFVELLEKHGDSEDRVGIVSHGGFMHVLISYMMNSTKPLSTDTHQRRNFYTHHNGAITRFNIGDDYNQLLYTNNVSYQPADIIT